CGWFVGDWQLVWLPLILGMAATGFLIWNFPPARIFMGDAGSGFLGLMLGGLALQAGAVSAPLIWSWLILLGVFVVDATFTLIHRL
ncbi:glycosyl transferase, partial [Pseudomonas sp. BAgro211]|nr:glycosyl transferase [Pseudomonas sp. BAgro211]